MKKVLSVIICLVLTLSFTACKEKGSNGSDHSIDVEYYANLGQINDVEYILGGDVDKAQQSLSADESDSEDIHGHKKFYYDYESGDYTVLTDGIVCCCYKTDDKTEGITHLVKYGDAYGFIQGEISTQVSEKMESMGFSATEREARDGELFFLPSTGELTVLQYDFEKNTVLFVFEEHALCTTVIYKK